MPSEWLRPGSPTWGAYMRKMALNGYVLHVDLSDIRELVALQRGAPTTSIKWRSMPIPTAIYLSEITALQKDYADLWGPLSDLIKSCRQWWKCDKGLL